MSKPNDNLSVSLIFLIFFIWIGGGVWIAHSILSSLPNVIVQANYDVESNGTVKDQ